MRKVINRNELKKSNSKGWDSCQKNNHLYRFFPSIFRKGGGALQLHKMKFLLFQDQKQVFAKQGFMLHRNKICFSHRKLCLKRIQLSLNNDFVFQNTLLLFLLLLLIFYIKKMQSFSHVSCFDKFQIWLLSNQM